MAHQSKFGSAAFERRFITEFLIDLDATAAAKRAGCVGEGLNTASNVGSRMLHKPSVIAKLKLAEGLREFKVQADAEMVLRELVAIATCDTNEIVELRRGCCRHCHGEEHRYQYRDDRERKRAHSAFLKTDEALVESFEHGGLDYDHKLVPHVDCPQCGGEGSPYVHLHDSRTLSPAARSLFAGAKQTKDGSIEVKLHSKDKYVEMLGRHLGMFNDKLEVNGNLAEKILKARKRVGG